MKTNEQKVKAIIYARVSSKEQEETGYSLEAQESLLKAYADQHNFELVKVYKVTESASGKQVRKMFIEMLQYATKEKVPVILCEKIDRLTRNLKDAATASDWIQDGEDREIHFVKESFVVSKNTRAHENFVWDMKVAMARFYANNLSEEVKKGQIEKVKQGWLATKPPLGYKTIGDKGHKIHVIDEEVAPYIRKMFEMYATGNFSTGELGKRMYELGFRSRGGGRVVKSKIHKLLGDVFYYGKFVWKGKTYQGKHEPIITRDLYDKVQEKMTRGKSPYYQKHHRELQGKISCGNCGKTVTWEKQKHQLYGACKHCNVPLAKERKYARYEEVEASLLARIATVAPQSERILQVLHIALRESHSEEIALHDAQVAGINASLERIKQRVRTMYNDRLDGRISIQEYDARVAEFTEEQEVLTNNLGKLNSDNAEYYKTGISIHELALRAAEIYKSKKASIDERRALLAYAFSSVTITRGVVTPEYTLAFNFMNDWMPAVNQSLEPVNKIAESIISSGSLSSAAFEMAKDRKDDKNKIRTAKNGSIQEPFDASDPRII
ncbi:recombinase family protein, partial [Candidatus Nomurabacteria bacterium]|nr:recombinase family protein [Candidatus Nomurabacteria bacterium]MCB9826668.1 recombinase family protein [Candidatus Nomurabacteria bacterium]